MITICTVSIALLGEGGGNILLLFLTTPVCPSEGEVPGPGDPVLTCDRMYGL